MAEYVPPRYNDPNYLGFDDFEKQLLKRGIVESYYDQAVTEAAGEAYIKAANQQAFKYSEARRAVAEALGTKHVIPAADTVIPQSAPGVVSSTGAKAIASAAGSTGAQSARVLKTAAAETVEQLARNPKTVAGALPIVGAVAAGVFEASGSRAAGRSWGDSVSRGIGGAIGGQFGWNLGAAGAAASSFNPIPAAVAAVGGGLIGQRLGARAGSVVYSGITGKIPGTIPWALRKTLDHLPKLFGREDKGDEMPVYNPAGKQQSDDVLSGPSFTGGQSPGVGYLVTYRFDTVGTAGQTLPQDFDRLSSGSGAGWPGPIGGITTRQNGGSLELILRYGNGQEGVLSQSTAPQGDFRNAKIVAITRADGQPDTGGDPPGNIATRPQVAPRPNSPIYNPKPAEPGNTPPSSNPTAPPNAPESPEDLEDKTKPLIPPISPAGSPAPSPIPPSTPNPATPAGSPTTIPNQSSSTNPAPSGSASGATDTPDLDTKKDTDTLKIHNPEGSDQIFKIPGYPDLKPGETIEVEDTESNRAIARAIYAALTGVVVGGGIIAAKKVADLNKTSTTPVQPPSAPPPQNPTDTGCRCNSPVLSRLDEFEKKLGLNNIVSGAGDASVMGYLQKMQGFAEKAWETSRLQKVINALTLVTVLHNASMISRDVGETLGQALAQGLDVLGIEDEKGQALDVNGWFGKQANSFFEGIFGAERWRGINETWNKANRIISSASNIVYTIRSISDGVKEVTEMAAENTGKIGNALKRSGLVTERSYPWMAEKVRAQDAWSRKTARIMDGLESAENTASSLAQVTGNVKEIQDEMTELKEQTTAFQTLVGAPSETTKVATPAENAAIVTAGDEGATNAKAGPAVTATDMEPGTNGTP